jgi:hypothetical protein
MCAEGRSLSLLHERGRGIAPRIVQRLELRALLGKLVQDIEQIAG